MHSRVEMKGIVYGTGLPESAWQLQYLMGIFVVILWVSANTVFFSFIICQIRDYNYCTFHISIWQLPKKGNAKECSNYHTIAFISHASKVMFKILQARLQQYLKQELPDVQAGCRKGRGTRDQIANICWITRKTSASLTTLKHLTVWITTNCRKFLKRREYQSTLSAS